jgi:hypothetical protein
VESPHKEGEAAEAAGGPSKSTRVTPADGREPDAGGEDSTDPDRGRDSELMTVVAAPKAGAEAADTGPEVTATKD